MSFLYSHTPQAAAAPLARSPTWRATDAAAPEPPTPARLTVLHLDDDILVLDKPAGLPVHPSSRYLHGTVVGRLRQWFGLGFAAPVHRLDRETSGVLVCARHRTAARHLSRAFAARRIAKVYWALCEGTPAAVRQTVRLPIAVGGPIIRIGVRVDAVHGKPATTACRLLQAVAHPDGPLALIEAWPRHGRRHQVRVHLQALGLPIVGDKIYGACPHLYERFAAGTLTAADRRTLRLPRQALHAAAIWLPHPGHGRRCLFAAPLPPDLNAMLAGRTHADGVGWREEVR